MSVWLCGWAAGECFAGGALLSLLGLTPIARPAQPGAAIGIGAFLLVWLTLWTFGGVSALYLLLRLFWGRDEVTLLPDGWTSRIAIGPWGKRHTFRAAEVSRVGLRRRDQALIVEAGTRTHVLTQFGTEADRRWLRDQLQDILARRTPAASAVEAAGPPRLPTGWISRPHPGGGVLITRNTGSRLAGAGCVGGIALFWNGITATALLSGLGHPTHGSGNPWAVLFITPFVAVGLLLIWGLLWTLFGTEEWRVRPGCLELSWRMLGWERTRTYLAGTLEVEVTTDSDGDEVWTLTLHSEPQKRQLDRGAPADLRVLGGFLAHHTGWPLRAADDLLN